MKPILYFLLLLALIVSCNNDKDYSPEIIDKEKDPPTEQAPAPETEVSDNDSIKYLFTQEDSIAKNKLVGLWRMVFIGWENTNYLDTTTSLDIVEFLPEGTVRRYTNYPDEYLETETYKISSDYFYRTAILPDSLKEEDVSGGKWIYEYTFYDNRFQIDFVHGGWNTFNKKNIYERYP